MIIIEYELPTALCYNVEMEKWSEANFEATEHIKDFSCSLIPKMNFF